MCTLQPDALLRCLQLPTENTTHLAAAAAAAAAAAQLPTYYFRPAAACAAAWLCSAAQLACRAPQAAGTAS
jgi:hypothetical protein